jgi:hypothetical protein
MGRFRSDRERLEYAAWLEKDRKEQEELAARLEAPLKLKELESKLNRNAQKLRNAKRFSLLEPDLQIFIPDYMYAKAFASEQELEEFNRTEAKVFYESTPEWRKLATAENIALLQSVFLKRGITAVSREMYASAFRLVEKAGLLEDPEIEAPAPLPVVTPVEPQEENFDNIPRLPLGHQTPVAYRRDTQQSYRGIDLLTGRERDYTQIEVDRMDSETYRKVFNVPTPALTRVNFLK